ncbi:PKD domain-containing protein [Gilvimarinus agarilyticus]|uniref:PKD domain-containing protein n=1 Tax=Gilvimarinus agarilyticus TaxID=679259 RepID=UPI0012FB8846|nr:hypothetical protein [Gilvimarinus agarilyticus]
MSLPDFIKHLSRASIRLIALASIVSFTACGGGGGGGGASSVPTATSSSSSSVESVQGLSLDAGPDRTVEEGEVVSIDVQINDPNNDIVNRETSRIEGPSVSLQILDFNDMRYQFVAPDTGVNTTVQLTYRFTVEDSQGNTAEDTITYTVNRVNQGPSVEAGAAFEVKAGESTSLLGSASDNDGEIVSHLWEQTSGDISVELLDSESSEASFVAPETDAAIDIEFTLSATDNDGEIGRDTVIVTLLPQNLPDVAIHFPGEVSYFEGGQLPVFGKASAIEGASISTITITTDVDSYNATVEADGSWRVNEVVIPDSVGQTSITVTAGDSEGRSTSVMATVYQEEVDIGDGEAWTRAIAVSVDSEAKVAWVLTGGNYQRDLKLIPVDLSTGDRGPSITDFTDEAQGITASELALNDMIYDRDNRRFIISSSPAAESLSPLILSVDEQTGMRAVVSGDGVGSGEDFVHPVSLTLDTAGRLYVAENGGDRVVRVNVNSGERRTYVDRDSSDETIVHPIQVAWDVAHNKLLVIPNFNWRNHLVSVSQIATMLSSSIVSAVDPSNGPSISDDSKGLAVDGDLERAYILNDFPDDVLSVNLNTGMRSLLDIDFPLRGDPTDIDVDSDTGIIYVGASGITGYAFYAVDPVSETTIIKSYYKRF